MFRRKTASEAPSQSTAQATPTPTYSGGYQSVEVPTFHGRKRKVVVYTSDASGKIIKTVKH